MEKRSIIAPASMRNDQSEFSAPSTAFTNKEITLRNVKLQSLIIVLIKQKGVDCRSNRVCSIIIEDLS